MSIPNIVMASNTFAKIVMPAIGWQPTADYQLLTAVGNAMGLLTTYNEKITPREPGWDLGYPIHIITPYSEASTNLSLNDIGHTVAQELLAQGKSIKVKWSGGIDSTFALTFLLENMQHSDQIEVLYTVESVEENPRYIQRIERLGVKMRLWSDEWQCLFAPDDIVISGDPGDTISGSVDKMFFAAHFKNLSQPWADFLILRGVTIDQVNSLTDKLSHYTCPIITLLDLYWWYQMCITHQFWTGHNMMWNLEHLSLDSSRGFFDHPLFDQWANVNRSCLHTRSFSDFKMPYKLEIARYWPDMDYLTTKVKQGGSRGTYWARKKIAKFQQQFLFLYLDRNEKIRAYCPDDYPFLDITVILQDLDQL